MAFGNDLCVDIRGQQRDELHRQKRGELRGRQRDELRRQKCSELRGRKRGELRRQKCSELRRRKRARHLYIFQANNAAPMFNTPCI